MLHTLTELKSEINSNMIIAQNSTFNNGYNSNQINFLNRGTEQTNLQNNERICLPLMGLERQVLELAIY